MSNLGDLTITNVKITEGQITELTSTGQLNMSGVVVNSIYSSANATTPALTFDNNGYAYQPQRSVISGDVRNPAGSGNATAFAPSTSDPNQQTYLSFGADSVTVSVTGVYFISFCTISDNTTGRVDSNIYVIDPILGNSQLGMTGETNGTGFHQKSTRIAMFLNSGTKLKFQNGDWYNAGISYPSDPWRTISIALLG